MKNLITLTVFSIILLFSQDNYSQWFPVNINPFIRGFAIDALDSSCAVIACNPGILRTLNGGNSWETISPPDMPSWGNGCDISMIDSLHIWYSDGEGKILNTSDGGKNWMVQFSDTSKTTFMNYIKMFDLQNGIAMGDGKSNSGPALFLKTSDGGANWISVNDSAFGGFSGDIWRRLDFISPNVGYFFASGSTERIYKTTDGCKTWKQTQTPSSVHVMNFYDENLGLCYGLNSKMGKGSIQRTTNGGLLWEEISYHPELGWGNDLEFLKNDPSKIWLTNYNSLYFSNDSGKTWSEQRFPAPQPIPDYVGPLKGRDLVFTDNACGWFLCDSMVYRNLKSDHTYPIVKLETEKFSLSKFSLVQNYPNPFNPTTKIKYSVVDAGLVTLKVYTLLGSEVVTLINEVQTSGNHEINFDAGKISSGVYFYQLRQGNTISTKKMILLR